MITLILGGARSGKSAFAQRLCQHWEGQHKKPVTYIATATVLDEEMRQRIARHQNDRPAHWSLIEAPLALAAAADTCNSEHILLIDCLTLWLNNHLFEQPSQDFPHLFSQLITSLKKRNQPVVLVANEVGLGVIPMGQVSRQFVDQAGWLNQAIAAAADNVYFVAAGLPMVLKGEQPIG